MPHACPWHAGTTKSKKRDSAPLMSSQPPSMSIMMRYSTSTTTVPQMHLLNHSMLKSNSLERISGELLTRSFSYSALRTYMHIPTKKLLTRLNLQLDALRLYGVDHICEEKISGKNKNKPVLDALIAKLKTGDQLIVWKLDRLGRRTCELIKLQEALEKKNIALISLTEQLNTSTPIGKFAFHLLCCIAEMERNIISERTIAGLTSAKAKGRIGGRKPGLTDQAKRKAKLAAIEYTKYLQNEIGTIDDVCRIVGVSRATLYKYLRIEGINIQGRKR